MEKKYLLVLCVMSFYFVGCDTGGAAQSTAADAAMRVDSGMPMCGTPEYMCPAGQECRLGVCIAVAIEVMPMGGTVVPMAGSAAGTPAMNTGGNVAGGAPAPTGGEEQAGGGGQVPPVMAGMPAMPMGGAVMAECARDFDCAVGDTCVNGRCVPRDQMMAGGAPAPMPMGGMEMPGGACMVTSDCPGNLLCDRGTCVRCRLDRDCAGNQRCEGGACEDIPPECMADNDCRADGSQRCVAGICEAAECFGDNQCRDGSRCVARSCVLGARGNGSGSCAMPTNLVLGEVARGTPQGGEQHQGSCSISADISGPEAVYAFTAPFTGAVCFTTAWYRWTGFIPDVYVRSGMCGNGMELGCVFQNDDDFANLASDNNQAAAEIRVREGETYHVFVDARISIDGDETYILSALRGTCDAVSLPTACDEVKHVEIGQPFAGNSTFGSRALEGSCGDGRDDGAEEVVHFRSGARPGSVCVRIDPADPGSTKSIYVRKTTCRDGNEVGCAAERAAGDRKITVATDPDTDYFVVVDSNSSGSTYRLLIEEGACPAD